MVASLPRCLLGKDRVLQSAPRAKERRFVTYQEELQGSIGTITRSDSRPTSTSKERPIRRSRDTHPRNRMASTNCLVHVADLRSGSLPTPDESGVRDRPREY
jgi:hypothetical protein